MTEYEPLTPSLRQDINIAFDKQIADLQTCQPCVLVNMQIKGLQMGKKIINALPDGYPIPLKREVKE